jgi:hypothetical protein
MIKHEIVNQDTVFSGSAIEIVETMRNQAYFERGIDLDIYLNHLTDLILQTSGVEITLEGDTTQDRTEEFVQALIKGGFFKEA